MPGTLPLRGGPSLPPPHGGPAPLSAFLTLGSQGKSGRVARWVAQL